MSLEKSFTSRLGGLALAAAAVAAFSCGGEPGRTESTGAVEVAARLAAAEESSWPAWHEVTAGVLPLRRATPGTVLMGRVDEVLHREGDRVAAGAVLARIESRDVDARLAQAEAAVAASRAAEENAGLMKQRMERLHARQAASSKNLEDAVAAYEAAAASLRAAEQGVVAARVHAGYSRITAPFAGLVVERRVEVGDTAAPGLPLFVVEDLSRVKIEAAIPESVAAGLRVGAAVEVEIAGRVHQGSLAEVLPAADPRSRTFTGRVLLDNPDGALRSGMFARLRLPGPEEKVVAVPEGAMVRQGPLTGIFVVGADAVARLRWVAAGRTREGRIEILSGLEPGERYVVEPPPGLQDGRRVEGT